MSWKKVAGWGIGGLFLLVGVLLIVGWAVTFHPPEVQAEAVTCPESAPRLQQGQALKVLSWNVQFMAGKEYV
ncbi:MAG: hypothetical protein ACRDIB_08455, partial [Ardenticatenaceae bacterium]